MYLERTELDIVPFTESIVEDAALGWLEALGYQVLHGPDIAVGEPGAERNNLNYRDVLLDERLREPVRWLISGELWVKDAERFMEKTV